VIIEILTVVSMLMYYEMMLSILVNIHQHSKKSVSFIFDHEDEILRHVCLFSKPRDAIHLKNENLVLTAVKNVYVSRILMVPQNLPRLYLKIPFDA